MTTRVFAAFDDDDFAWWIRRAADGGQPDRAHRTLGHRDRDGVNAWYAAREERHETAAYAADLDLCWRLADEHPPTPESLGLRCRYALLRALLGDLGSRVPPSLAALLVRHGVWTREQALAWADLSFGEASLMRAVADAIDDAQGVRREHLLSRALAANARYVTEGGPSELATMASRAAPHEQARLLDTILTDPDKGGRLDGLRAIVPYLPVELLDRARDAAAAFADAGRRAEALLAVAGALPADRRPAAYAEALAAARDRLRAGGDRGLLDRLAEGLPIERLTDIFELANDGRLPAFERQEVLGAVIARFAEADPETALRYAEDLADGPRDRVHAAAALVFARSGRMTEAVAAVAAIGYETVRASTLDAVVNHVTDVAQPALLAQVRRLSPYFRLRALRTLGGRVPVTGRPDPPTAAADPPAAGRPDPLTAGPVSALVAVADTFPDERDRPRARAAVAAALTPAEVTATLDDLLADGAGPDPDALGQLAPFLDADQVRRALDGLARPSLSREAGIAALAVRLAALGRPEEALRRVAALTDPVLERPDVLATLAPALPPRVLPDVVAAVRPAPVAAARIAARAALAAHLPAARVRELVRQADALGPPTERATALAAIAATGVPEAQPRLAAALRDTYGSTHGDRFAIAVAAVETVAAAGVAVSVDLVAAVTRCPRLRGRAAALLALACSARGAGARAAADLLVSTSLLGHLPGADERDGRRWRARTGVLAAAALALRDPERFASAVAEVAAIVRPSDLDRLRRRAVTIGAAMPRLLALAALSGASARLAADIAEAERPRLDEWRDSPLLPLGLEILARGGVAPPPGLVDRAWRMAAQLDDPAAWTVHVSTLAAIPSLRPPAGLGTALVDEALDLPRPWRERALTGLAPLLDAGALATALDALRGRSAEAKAATPALAAGAVRGARLGDHELMMAFLDADTAAAFPGPSAVVAAAPGLPPAALRVVAGRTDDQDALAAVAASAAAQHDRPLTLATLARITSETCLTAAIQQVAPRVSPAWARELLPLVDTLWEGPRAEALAALIPRLPRADRDRHVEAAVAAAHGYRIASAPRRLRILTGLRPYLEALPPDQLAAIWTRAMRETGSIEREEVLVDVAALAGPLARAFGAAVAVALDDAITVGAADSWPGPADPPTD